MAEVCHQGNGRGSDAKGSFAFDLCGMAAARVMKGMGTIPELDPSVTVADHHKGPPQRSTVNCSTSFS